MRMCPRSLGIALSALVAGSARAQAPSLAEVHQNLRSIEASVLRGEVDTVRMEFEQKAKSRPGDLLLRIYIAWCQIPSDESWNILKGITAIHPDNPWAHLGMGRVYTRWKMRDQAESEFRAALKGNPKFYPALTGLGDVARAAGRSEEAQARYREALSIDEDAQARTGLGLLLFEQGKVEEAKKELSRAVELWPEQPAALSALAQLARDGQDPQASVGHLAKLTELVPRDREARRALADLRFELGDKEAAAQDYERLLSMGAVDAQVLSRMRDLYAELKNAQAEEKVLLKLSGLDRQSPEHPLRLAELLEQRSALEEAEGELVEASSRAPTRGDILLRLGRLRVKRDLLREALEAYRGALAAGAPRTSELTQEIDAVAQRFKLPKRPVGGTVDQIYSKVFSTLNAFYSERLKANPKLGGALRLRVRVDDAGQVLGVDTLEDSVGDSFIAGHVYFALRDAAYPKKKREPVFEFQLQPPKGK